MSLTAVHNNPAPIPTAPLEAGAEFAALVSDCGVYALSERAKIAVTGSDRVRWLNGMLTNNVRDLAAGHGLYAFLLNPQGRILGDLYAYNCGDRLILDTDQTQLQKLLSTFDHYIIMDDVELADISEKLAAIGIAGPTGRAVLHALGIDLPDLQPLETVDVIWRDSTLTAVRGDNSSVESYEFWLPPAEAVGLRDALIAGGAKPVSAAGVELLRIASGIPRYGRDINERDLPQETEQTRALHFSKGCYIGQEIVERIRSRGGVHRKFSGFDMQGPAAAPGTKIQAEGKDIGEITSVASLPSAGGRRPVALGYIRREATTAGKAIHADNAQLSVVPLPFAGVFQPATSK